MASNKSETSLNQAGSEKRDEVTTEKEESLPLHLPDELKAGVFSNNAFIDFNPEQFNLDFFNIARMSNAVVARVVTTPQSFKRFTMLCVQQLKKYEEKHGTLSRHEPTKEQNAGEKSGG